MEIAARMHGWQTRTLPELKVVHFGLVGAGAGGPLKARFKWGRMNFHLGYHPLFQLARSVYRAGEPPLCAGKSRRADWIHGWQDTRPPPFCRWRSRALPASRAAHEAEESIARTPLADTIVIKKTLVVSLGLLLPLA